MSSRARVGAAVAAAVLGLAGAVSGAGPAQAGAAAAPIAGGLVGPLGLDIAPDGSALVAEAFRGAITRVQMDGTRSTVVEQPGEVEGPLADGDGVVFAFSGKGGRGAPVAQLRRWTPTGGVEVLGYLGGHEVEQNPDSTNTYGFQGLSASCVQRVPKGMLPHRGRPYSGTVDSHPYSTARTAPGTYVVADAGGNDLVEVGPGSTTRTVAVLPPVPVVVTPAMARANHLPECVVDHVYRLEPVPTDVEVGPDGLLYVTSLAGGPEDGSLGGTGGVFRVNPTTGAVTRIAAGLAGATGLAVDQAGRIWVSELFGGRVSLVRGGVAHPVASLPLPAALEVSHGVLYATADVFNPDGGVLVRVPR